MAYEEITEGYSGSLREAGPEVRATFEDLATMPVKQLTKVREEFSADLMWARYYEFSAGSCSFFLASVGTLGLSEASVQGHTQPQQAAIEALEKFDSETSTQGRGKGVRLLNVDLCNRHNLAPTLRHLALRDPSEAR